MSEKASPRGNLVIKRNQWQALQIGQDVTVTVTEIGSDFVRLAIEAPRSVHVLRRELVGKPKKGGQA